MNSSNFQLIVSGVFIIFLVAGVATFALFTAGGGSGAAGAVDIWGTAERTVVDAWLNDLRQSGNKALEEVRYTQVPAHSYQDTLVDAMASGRGPDLFMVTDEALLALADKMLVIPYGNYPQSAYASAFVDEAALFMAPDGLYALPVMIDPLVMYWNRDLLAAAGVANPPQYWNDLLAIAPKITSLEAGNTVRRSAVAMGTWRNVSHAKPLLATLMLQAGETIVTRGADGRLVANLGGASAAESPAASALRFYTEFGNPAKTTYSWSAALPNSTNAFLSGDVALYFGFASELATLRARNPNLRFDAAAMPQLRQGGTATYGRLTGLAVARTSDNPGGALVAATQLSNADAVRRLAALSPLPPVRRDVSLDTSGSAAASVFNAAALIARGWLDPDPAASDAVFKDMIESVISGRQDPSAAVFDAQAELAAILEEQQQ